jgi:hypothetical protein
MAAFSSACTERDHKHPEQDLQTSEVSMAVVADFRHNFVWIII